MKAHNTYINKFRDRQAERKLYGVNGDLCHGVFRTPRGEGKYPLLVIASNGGGWDHVSVSRYDSRMPSWEDMAEVKRLFFEPEETVVQFLPKESEYVNNCNCLHLWKKQGYEFPLPPSIFTGIKEM